MEIVHTVWEFYDGPRTGLADYRGQPHYYSCRWGTAADNYSETFALSPVGPDILAPALEQWAIWRRWEIAFHAGQVSGDSHPGRGGENSRYDALQRLLQERLDALPSARILAHARFEPDPNTQPPPGVMRTLLVEWLDVT